jgi:hypothetical protein
MVFLVFSLLAAEPTFMGGIEPQPLSITPMKVDETPTESACSTETLRRSKACHFDGRPAPAASASDRDRQAKDNIDLAERIGRGICLQRNAKSTELTVRVNACSHRVHEAAKECDLEGVETLIDTQGRFSTHAHGCYVSLAEALQLGDVPALPADGAVKKAEARRPVPSTEL